MSTIEIFKIIFLESGSLCRFPLLGSIEIHTLFEECEFAQFLHQGPQRLMQFQIHYLLIPTELAQTLSEFYDSSGKWKLPSPLHPGPQSQRISSLPTKY